MLLLVVVVFLFYYNWIIGIISLFVFIILYANDRQEERRIRKERIDQILTLSTQVDEAGEEAFLHLPVGVILYNEAYEIEWINPYVRNLLGDYSWRKQPLSIIDENLIESLEADEPITSISFGQLYFKVRMNRNIRAIFLLDQTDEKRVQEKYENERLVIATIYLDNYEEIARNLADNIKSTFNSLITTKLNEWADEFHFYIKKTGQDRFFAVMNQQILAEIEASKFEILNEIRSLKIDKTQLNPITLSIGIGSGNAPMPELAKMSESALDLALGRGGDQIAIRDHTGKVRFYGGQTNPMEKRTRVRARVISHALAELVKQSDNVIIMGHKSPDMDSLGASLGVLNIAKSNDVEGYIVFDEDDITTGIEKVIDKIKEEETLWRYFISPEEADAIYTNRSLIVVVDTNKPSLVVHEMLLRRANQKVVIDHHRRGEDFIDNPTLVYIEPYASSTSELVTELIEYQPKRKNLTTIEATTLLAGIIVDTKSFSLRTGARTFDAASYLRLKGADSVLIQQFLKEDLQTVIKRNSLLERAYIFQEKIAIIKADEAYYDQIMIAQAADILLTIDEIEASFVIAKRDPETVAISARSLGSINVQLIMEAMHGGGHLTNAATQLTEVTLDETEQWLKETIINYMEERK